LDFYEFKRRLQTEVAFADWERWTITKVSGGMDSGHTYRFRAGDRDYFVKEIKDNERDILKLLVPLGLMHVEEAIHPDLLDENILVTAYDPRGPLRRKEDLDPDLVREFALIQNHFNASEFVREPLRDHGFGFGRYAEKCFHIGYGQLLACDEHNYPIIKELIEVANHLVDSREALIAEYSGMPFARQHHDFREANISAGPPQRIRDWGSSYGHGPFLFDLAPFVLHYEPNLTVLIRHSDICKQADRKTVERWVYVAACVRFMELLRWFLAEPEDQAGLAEFLAHEHETYSRLLP
jgi:hypothetical protein